MSDTSGIPAPVSYLDLVERNNELLAHVLNVFTVVGLPEELRPPPAWQHLQHLVTPNAAYPLLLHLEAFESGLVVTLKTPPGHVIWRHQFEWGPPRPEVWY